MEIKIARYLNDDKLRTCIFKITEVANKICSANDEIVLDKDTVILNQQLEKLMIKYMDLRKIKYY